MSYSIESQVKLIEEKKQELLMKTSTKNKQTPTPNTASQSAISPAAAPSGPSLFMNDGNFLARFQAMQKQNTPSGTTQDNEKNSGKFSIKLSNVKKKDQPKVVATNSSAFEKHNPLSVFTADEESSAKIKEDPSSSYQYSSQTSTQRNDSKFRQTPDAPGAAAVASSSSSLLGKRKRKNRWDEKSEEDCSSTASSDAQLPSSSLAAASSPGGSNLAPASSSNENPADIMAEFQKAKALIQQKAAQAKSALSAQSMEQQRQIQEQKLMQEMYMKIIEEQAAAAKKRIKKKEDKPRYEYDSDEDIDGGTWEHKKRMKEMEKTRADAQKLTEMSKGKHHMSDFLPKEELAKFEEKVRAIKEGRKADLSDYAEFKIKEDNIGFKMLQKAGWQEGKGLGSEGKGITEPINKGQTSLDNSGVGVEKPHEVEKDDDQFDIYRKRMMLAYKFRPNPLNNPRRPYY